MGFLDKIIGSVKKGREELWTKGKREGPLVHVFLFDSGPVLGDRSKYVVNVLQSLLPEALSRSKAPVRFVVHESMPFEIGEGGTNIKRAMKYEFAWATIAAENRLLVEGVKTEHKKYDFICKEYHRETGNRGVLYAFYKVI